MLMMIAGFALTDGGGPGASAFQSRVLIAFVLVLWLLSIGRHPIPKTGGNIVLVSTLLATAGATLGYTLTWEAYLALTDYAFIEHYLEQRHATLRANASSTNPERMEAQLAQTEKLRSQLLNPVHRWSRTALEFVPTATVVIGAGLLALQRKAR